MKKQILNKHGLRAVMLFIAELNGFKSGSVKAKERTGINCWLNTTLHDLDYSDYTSAIKANSTITEKERAQQLQAELKRQEDTRAEAHENIWLERLYSSLDKHFQLGAFSTTAKETALNDREALKRLFSRHNRATHLWDVPIELDASALTNTSVH